MYKLPPLVLFLILTFELFGQLTTSISVNYGFGTHFNFNTMQEYQNGITHTQYTQLNLTYKHDDGMGNPVGSNWQLTVTPVSVQINGNTGTQLNLSQIQITAETVGGATINQTLTNAPIVIAQGTQTVLEENITVNITYSCGIAGSLLGETADNYLVNLEFSLEQVP